MSEALDIKWTPGEVLSFIGKHMVGGAWADLAETVANKPETDKPQLELGYN